jgi:hypothetical protein
LRRKSIRRLKAEMKKLIRDLLVLTMLGIVSVGAFAQKKDEKRPEKVPAKVITNKREESKPPQNNNQPRRESNRNKPD